MKFQPTFCALICATLITVVPGPARAGDVFVLDIEITGADGMPGVPGTAGDPATDGGNGGDGEIADTGSVTATTDAADPAFQVLLTGGSGGDGGDGGDAAPAGDGAGNGGDGGDGGAADAHIQFLGGDGLWGRFAMAGTAGNGGNGGDAGAGSGGVARGGNGGDGGDIQVDTTGDTQFLDSSFLQHTLVAGDGGHGGVGGNASNGGSGGAGGGILMTSELVNAGDGEVGNQMMLTAGDGGDGASGGSGGAGGSVEAQRISVETNPDRVSGPTSTVGRGSLIEVFVTAVAGAGGSLTAGRAGDGGEVVVDEVAVTMRPAYVPDIVMTLEGGDGGHASGAGRAGDGGNVQLGSVSADGTDWALIGIQAVGGDGGDGFGLADSGNGASIVVDRVTDVRAPVYARVFQDVFGGHSGAVEEGQVGHAGDATSRVALDGDSSLELSAGALAVGGTGGDRRSTAGVAGSGGQADAEVDVLNAGTVSTGTVFAQGGDGGHGTLGASGGGGGGARAHGRVQAAERATLFADAFGGTGYHTGGVAEAAATAVASMRSRVEVGATTANSMLESVFASVVVKAESGVSAVASSSFNDVIPFAADLDPMAWTRATVLPDVDDVTALIQSNPNVAVNFDLSGGSDLFGYVGIGAGYQPGEALDSYTHRANFAVDTAHVAHSQNLLVGFLDASATDGDFGSFLMTISVGSDVVLSHEGSDGASVAALLDNQTYDLGSLASLAAPDRFVDLRIALVLTGASVGQGLEFDLVFGNSTLGIGAPVPLPGGFWLLLTGLFAVAGQSSRRLQNR